MTDWMNPDDAIIIASPMGSGGYGLTVVKNGVEYSFLSRFSSREEAREWAEDWLKSGYADRVEEVTPCRSCEGASEALERVAALEAALREAVGYLTAEADIHAGAEEGYRKGFEAGLAYSQHDADRCTCGNVKRGRPCKMDCPNQGGTTGSYSLTSPDHPYVMHGTVRTTDPVLVTEPGPEGIEDEEEDIDETEEGECPYCPGPPHKLSCPAFGAYVQMPMTEVRDDA